MVKRERHVVNGKVPQHTPFHFVRVHQRSLFSQNHFEMRQMKRARKHSKMRFVVCSQWVRLGCGPGPCVCCRDPGDCLVCSVAIPATVFPSCLCGLAALVSRKVFRLVMGSDGFQTNKRICLGCRARSGPKGFWRRQSQSMAERSGRANSVRSRMCGRGGVAGDVIMTSRQGCTGSTGRVAEEERKARSLEAENEELRARIDAMGKNEGVQNGPGISFKEEGDLEEVWRDYMEAEDEDECRRNWMKREKRYRRSYERSRDCLLLRRKCRRTSRSQCNISCKRWRKGGTISCLSTRRCKRGHKRYKASKTRDKFSERELGGKRRNAENQRRNCVEGRALHTAGGQSRQKHNGRRG